MKHSKLFLFYFLVIAGLLSCGRREDVRQYAATESYPDDTILQSIENRRAMIVIAHDDDMCAMAGTASLLNRQGWEVAVVSIARNPERDAAQVNALRNTLDTVMFAKLTIRQIRNDSEGQREHYLAFPRDSFEIVFNKDIIEEEYLKHINHFNPEVIFTLDNEIGGYGHPEHVLVSQMVIDLAAGGRITPSYIYQGVYTDHMENTIMKRHSERMKSWGFPGDEWDNAKRIYGVDGMPEPTVQINIMSEAEIKMDYLRSYNKRERKTLGFFVPEFEKYDAAEYFSIFDREFFRIIKTGT